jgi:rhodanese-related sulfurtransferase
MNFEEQLKSLVYFHLEEHQSAAHLLQVLDEDEFAREHIAPEDGIKKSSFSEAINSRGLEQMTYVFQELQKKATNVLPKEYAHLGNLVAIDGSLIDAVLSMHWADYRKSSKKAKIHLGFDLNRSIPLKLYLTNGKQGERPFVSQVLSTDQTGVLDRGYQCHELFDAWQEEDKKFVCRIRANTKKTALQYNEFNPESFVFYDAIVLLGTPKVNQTQKNIRLVGYRVDNKDYWVATNRYDLAAEDIALIYKLRWQIEKFFAWWKKHLKVYHLIARSQYGLMIQILSGLITYLLLAIYCYEQHYEKVSIKRVRELRNKIQNELRNLGDPDVNADYFNEQCKINDSEQKYANT